ncbi:hypothetical protein [Methylobacterium thuringiense]|uniref:hypothetical protein n=1 Tax=Methylobacterium thuringiense TaxID=1003091 RepID=UPI001EE00489|nr:hypothetical protein [Methylobacterium thuringiense]
MEKADRDHDGWPERVDYLCGEYVYFYCTVKIVLSRSDVIDIWEKISSANQDMRAHADFLTKVIDSRISNFGKWKKIVSLGTDCLPRTIATRWGLKRPRALGELSHPFDLNISPVGALPGILSSGFAGYTDNLVYRSDLGFPVSDTHGSWFNHEHGKRWAENDFAETKFRYAKRIRSFLDALNDGQPTTLVLHVSSHLDQPHFDYVLKTFEAVRSLGSNEMSFLCLATNGVSVASSDVPNVTIADVVRPSPDYDWSQHQHYISSGGLKFETEIVSAMESAVSGMFSEAHGVRETSHQ